MDPKETNLFALILIVGLLIGTLMIFFVVSLIRNQRIVVKRNRENLLQEIATLEQERSRVAADLHDELGPLLSQIKFRLSSIEVPDKEDEEQLQLSSDQIDLVVQRIRTISRNLLPAALVSRGLRSALEESLENLRRYASLQTTLEYTSTTPLPNQQQINLFRAIQEVCQNTVKHAAARRLLVKVWDEKDGVHILCEDDGKGFRYPAIMQDSKGIGLKNLRNRIELLGGKFEVLSEDSITG
jgi:signal transduction histidine kinase